MDTRRDEHFLNIGRIVNKFQALEHSLIIMTGHLLAKDQGAGQIVAAQLSFSRLCTLVQSLFEYQYSEQQLIERMRDVIARASEAEAKRNIAVHSSLLLSGDPDDKTVTRYKITLKRGEMLKTRLKKLSAEDLKEDASSIGQVAEDVWSLIESLPQILVGQHSIRDKP